MPSVVLDCFAGVGTTCWTARELGRASIGIDLSEEYLEVAGDPEAAKAIRDFLMRLMPAVYGEEPRRRSKGVSRRRPESLVVKYEQMGLF